METEKDFQGLLNDNLSLSGRLDKFRKTNAMLSASNDKLNNEIHNLKKERDNLLDHIEVLKLRFAPLQNSVNSLTAERSKWLRKIKRLENKG